MTLEGWVPEIGPYLTLAEVVEFAFDYRGNTTIVKTDGTEVVGYVFNRNTSVPRPVHRVLRRGGEGPFTVPLHGVANIKFTGRTPRRATSWKAWVERREREKAGAEAPAGAPSRPADPDLHRG